MTSLAGYYEFYLVLFSHCQFSFMLIVFTSNILRKIKTSSRSKTTCFFPEYLFLLIAPPTLPMEELVLKAKELNSSGL